MIAVLKVIILLLPVLREHMQLQVMVRAQYALLVTTVRDQTKL
jgi:hypothetical protein